MKPICAKCQRFFRPARNGIPFIEGMPKPGIKEPIQRGAAAHADWQPYKLWMGDLWRCHGCGAELIIGPPGNTPVSEHYKPDFADEVKRLAPILQVNDC